MGRSLLDDALSGGTGLRAEGPSSTGPGPGLVGGGAMGELIRTFDWSTTPVGPVERWPQSLRTALSILLDSLYPMLILWGPEYVQFYNDAYRPVLGATKHPRALGQRAQECWPEIWAMIGPMFARVLTRGEPTWSEDLLFVLDRNGYLEETYFTFCYSAIRDESGAPGGVLVTCVETTGRVLSERRLRCLRELAAQVASAVSAEAACAQAARTLADHAADVPCALLYLLEDQGTQARLVGAAGLDPGTPASPPTLDLGDHNTPLQEPTDRRPPAVGAVPSTVEAAPGGAARAGAVWPLGVVARTGQALLVPDVLACCGPLPGGPWPEPPTQALVLPIGGPGEDRPTGLLVAALSPRRALDDDYRGFLDLVAGQIATAVANARAREEERKRAEALAALDRAKTAFFSNVSHEFRTPLTLALGPVADVLDDPTEALSARGRGRLEIAHRNGLRLLRLVNTLLDFSRIEAGRVDASYEPTDLAALTADLASTFRSASERAGLHLVVDCPPLPAPVYVDRDMWEKIVLNLLSNAFKFTFAGEIAVRLHVPGERAVLEVRDTGTGIPAHEVPHIFERFYRVRAARGRTQEGTGIGLALVRELVTLHGGTIDAQSAVDEGTTMTVTLPLGTAHLPPERIGAARALDSTALGAAPYVEEAVRWLPDGEPAADGTADLPAERAVPPGGAPAAEAPLARVLLADDNADMRAYVRHLLGARYAVEAVADGAAALVAARAHAPDLVLADVMMPGLDGIALLRALRADPRTATIPVILLSARAGEEARVEGLAAGADDYLTKPFSARELLARVQAHVALGRLREEARAALAAERDRLQAEVAARVLAEAELRRQVALVALAHDAIIMRDPAGTIITWNNGAATLYGWTADEAAGQITHALLNTRVLPNGGPGTEIDTALATHDVWEGELEHTRRDGTRLVVESRQALLRAADGTPEVILEVNRDASLRRELAAALARLQTLQAISESAFAQLALPALLRQVLERITAALAADNTAILLLDESGETLIVHHAVGPEEAQTGQMRVPVGRGVAGRIAATRQPLVLKDVRAAEPVNPLLREQMAALMGVPLLVEGRLLGVLHVDSATPRQFTADELHLLQMVADRVALALDNARLYREALEARDQVIRLQRVTAALSAATTPGEVAEVVIAQGLAALGAARGSVALLAEDGASFTVVGAAGYAPEVVAHWATFSADTAVPIADAVRTRAVVLLASRAEREARYPHLAGVRVVEDDGAMVAIPLRLGERALGALGLGYAQPRRFSAEEQAMMGALGELCAQALERAQLYEAVQRAWAEAEAERQHLSALFTQAPAIIAVLRGPEHTFAVANPLYVRLVGRRDAGELLGWPVRAALPEVVGQGYFELLDQAYATGTPFVGTEMPVKLDRRGDGTLDEVLVNFVYQPYRNAAGAVEGIFVHGVEVTEQVWARQRVEELARQVEAERDRLQQVLDLLPEAVLVTDTALTIQFSNRAVHEILGLDVTSAGAPLGAQAPAVPDAGRGVFAPDSARHLDGLPYEAAEMPLARALRQGEPVRGEQMLVRHADGRDVPILVNAAPLRDPGGAITGGVMVFQDITALRDLERAREAFLAAAAHDLKNPLAGIRGQAQLAQRRLARLDAPAAAPVLAQLTRILEGTDAMLGLINELVDVTRQQMSGGLALHRAPTDLVALVQDCLEAQREASSRTIHLEADVPELHAEVDAARVGRVVGNLLSNALKYSSAERAIWVRLERDEGSAGPRAVLSVRDEGLGIPAADLPRIFDRFTRARNVGQIPGTGIGLASARDIVEQHGGTIAVQSTEGAGSTFTVRLPLGPS